MHQILLMSHSLGLSFEAVFEDVFLMYVQGLVLFSINDVQGSFFQDFIVWNSSSQWHVIFI